MSKYTTELRYICENNAGLVESAGYNSIDMILSKAAPKIFDFDFPIFDEEYRMPLEKKILKHFYTREICEETVGLWKLRLDTKINEIMPYYNQLYLSELIKIDPLSNYKTTRENDRNTEKNKNEKEKTKNVGVKVIDRDEHNSSRENGGNDVVETNINKYSDTPQGSINGVLNDSYLTNANVENTTNKETNETNVVGTNSLNESVDTESTIDKENNHHSLSVDKYVETLVGYSSISSSDLLIKFRKTFLNIDMLIIGELDTLFMQLW